MNYPHQLLLATNSTLSGNHCPHLLACLVFQQFFKIAFTGPELMTMDNHKRIGNATFPCINLIATSTATANTLRNRLRSLAISFEPNAQKPELQALCSLHQLGVIQTGCTADQKLVHQVRLWWEMDLKARSKELERLDLDDTGKRLDNIKSLILKL